MAEDRLSQEVAEIQAATDPNARLTQEVVEVQIAPATAPHARLTQEVAEVQAAVARHARLTQIVVEVQIPYNPNTFARVTQAAVLALVPYDGCTDLPPNPPMIAGMTQVGLEAVALVEQAPVTGAYPIVAYRLYAGPTNAGPWTLRSETPLSTSLVLTGCPDPGPFYGINRWYIASAVDSFGNESAASSPVPYIARVPSWPGPGVISAAAYGPQAVLGTDAFLDPVSGEGVIGPNGDLLYVTGANCLAQDLRIRMLTYPSELRLHPAFGLVRMVGAGQGNAVAQAQIMRANAIDALRAEPRVADVPDLVVQRVPGALDGWILAYDVLPIGSEDTLRLNMVFPFWKVPQP